MSLQDSQQLPQPQPIWFSKPNSPNCANGRYYYSRLTSDTPISTRATILETMNDKILARIPRKAITHLFRDKFPYKVETTYPASKFVRGSLYTSSGACVWPTTPEQLKRAEFMADEASRYLKIIGNFRKLCMRFVPDDSSTWKIHETQMCFHFYFLHKADMEAFAVGNHKRVRAIYEPSSASDIRIMSLERNVIIRDSLFHDAYRYCITFRPGNMRNQHIICELDGWIAELFGDDTERLRYTPAGNARKLYLSAEHDILLTQLAFSRLISRVQKIILRSEIISDGSIVSEEAGGEGRDPPEYRV